jgi:hypothetical protein
MRFRPMLHGSLYPDVIPLTPIEVSKFVMLSSDDNNQKGFSFISPDVTSTYRYRYYPSCDKSRTPLINTHFSRMGGKLHFYYQ